MTERMVGRHAELRALGDLLDSARAGRGRGLLLLGDAGIGKTTLAGALAEQATGCTVGWGRCPEVEAVPYWPWRQALQPLEAAAPLSESATAGRASMFADVADRVARATTVQPAVLIVEDLQLADDASFALLRFLAGVLPELPCLLVLTSRDNSVDVGPAAAAALESLPSIFARLGLQGLDRADTEALVAQVLGRPDAQFAEAVHRRTGGNPFFVQELARLRAIKGTPGLGPPLGVQQIVGHRLARLRQQTYDCLSAAAVLGDEVEAEVLAEVADLPIAAVLNAVADATAARLARLDGSRVRFAHALVQEVLYTGLTAGQRAALHGRAGQVLAGRAAPATVADHFRRAVGQADAAGLAAEHALLAARDAMQRGGYEQAVRFFEDAAAANADPDVLLGLGEAQVLAGELIRGRACLRELARERLAAHDPETAARALLAMGGGAGGFEVDLGDSEQATLLEQALPLLDDGATKAATLARAALARAHGRMAQAGQAMANEAIEMARRLDEPRIEAAAISAWCDTAAGPDHVIEREAQARRMLTLSEGAGDRTLALLARRLLVVALLEQGKFPAADEQIAAYATAAEKLRAAYYGWPVPIWRGMRALMRADYSQVDACLDEAAELARRAQSDNAELMAFTLRIGKAHATGAMADYMGTIDAVMAPFADVPMAQGYLAYYLAEAGAGERAALLVEQRMADGLAAIPKDGEWLTCVALLGDAGRLVGHRAAVSACAAALEPYRDLWLYDGMGAACYGSVAQFLDRCAGYLGDRPAEPPSRAVGEWRRTGAVWSVSWRGTPATIADAKGVRDLAVLLRQPRRPVHVLDLIGSGVKAGGDTGPALDQQARTAYTTRLRDLADELAEAEQFADSGRAERLRTEQEFIAHELGAALGLDGRARTSGDPVERARKAVSMRIGAAIKALEQVHPSLGRHLRASVRTGRHCVYEPEDEVTWHT